MSCEQYKTANLILRTVNDKDLLEVARTWPSDHRPVSETVAHDAISKMYQNYEKNRLGCIYHLCLAVCGKDNPKTIMGWCGLDGRRSHTEPEIFILLDEEYRNKVFQKFPCVTFRNLLPVILIQFENELELFQQKLINLRSVFIFKQCF